MEQGIQGFLKECEFDQYGSHSQIPTVLFQDPLYGASRGKISIFLKGHLRTPPSSITLEPDEKK